MRVLAVGSAKGGVSKTTSALYLAVRAATALGAREGDRAVAIVDRDESRNLTRLLAMRPELRWPGVDLVDGEDLPRAYQLVVIDTPPGLSAIPSLKEADGVLVPVLPEDQGVTNLTPLPARHRQSAHHRFPAVTIARAAAGHGPAHGAAPRAH